MEKLNYLPKATEQQMGVAIPATAAQITANAKFDPNTGARLFVPCDLYGITSNTLRVIVRSNVSGVLPQSQTLYSTPMGLQSTYLPLEIVVTNGTVTLFQLVSRVANGLATDKYTLVKNGIDTTMTFSVTNASTGSTTANQVAVVTGDTLGIKVTTDAATVGEDLLISFVISS